MTDTAQWTPPASEAQLEMIPAAVSIPINEAFYKLDDLKASARIIHAYIEADAGETDLSDIFVVACGIESAIHRIQKTLERSGLLDIVMRE